jgi:hypothetical protein
VTYYPDIQWPAAFIFDYLVVLLFPLPLLYPVATPFKCSRQHFDSLTAVYLHLLASRMLENSLEVATNFHSTSSNVLSSIAGFRHRCDIRGVICGEVGVM